MAEEQDVAEVVGDRSNGERLARETMELILQLGPGGVLNPEHRPALRGLAVSAHVFLPDLAIFWHQHLKPFLEAQLLISGPTTVGLFVLHSVLLRGPRLDPNSPLLSEMERFVQNCPATAEQRECMRVINLQIQFFPRVVGRWAFDDLSPLIWMEWEPSRIAIALTSLCKPFFDLRPVEFDSGGPNLTSLNLYFNTVSNLVVTSVLRAVISGGKAAVQVVCKWLAVADQLLQLRNFHMLFAIQNGLQKHQVDRLKDLWSSVPKPCAKLKTSVDALFSVETRMAGLLDAQSAALKAKSPGSIPCIFWLCQKTALLKETPSFTDDGKINSDYLIAANNIFKDFFLMQELRYTNLGETDETERISFYFLQIDKELQANDDELYILSDSARVSLTLKPSRGSKDPGWATPGKRRSSSVSGRSPSFSGANSVSSSEEASK